jgi:sarcosine oxidase subunit beta
MQPDIVIIGAGVVGASIAAHLSEHSGVSVLVLERALELGTGSAGRATGGFRAQFATDINVRLSLLAREKLRRFREEVGADAGYTPAGYLFLATDAAQLTALRAGLAVQRKSGLTESREVSRAEAQALNPHAWLNDVVGGTFCPTDGFIRPLDILHGYAAAARRRNVHFEFGCGPVRWRMEERSGRRRVTGVDFGAHSIATQTVVIATGAWSGLLAAHGVSIPVEPERRQIAVTEPFATLPATMPMTIWCNDGFHLRHRDGRVLLLKPDVPLGADPFSTTFDPQWLEPLLAVARARVPCLESARIDLEACRAGLYEMTPDKHALVGPVPEVDGLYLATGNSGHGVMHAPAIGQLIAEMILDGGTLDFDARPLRPSRFAENEPNPASGVL